VEYYINLQSAILVDNACCRNVAKALYPFTISTLNIK